MCQLISSALPRVYTNRVIVSLSELYYSEMFAGLLFSLAKHTQSRGGKFLQFKSYIASLPEFRDVVVVAPANGTEILALLSRMPEAERRQRRAYLRMYAPLMQWAWDSPSGDALSFALGALQTPGVVLEDADGTPITCGL